MSKGKKRLLTVILCMMFIYITKIGGMVVYVPTASMEHTIMSGTFLYGSRLYGDEKKLSRGDIAVLRKDKKSKKYVKRIIGLPNETVYITNGQIIIITQNKEKIALSEPYLPEKWTKKNTDMIFQVPDDSYLVLGDNRNHSIDSRTWDPPCIEEKNILAKLTYNLSSFKKLH